MNDFLITQLAKEHQARIARAAEVETMIRAAEGSRSHPARRRRRGIHLRPRNS